MARTAMVTRTITATKVMGLFVNIETREVNEGEFILSGTYKDYKSLMKALEKTVSEDTHKIVSIISTEEIETLYGMTEQDFIQHAKVLPPRKIKA